MSEGNKSNYFNVPAFLYENRYCNEEGFNFLVCGRKDKHKKRLNQVVEVEIPGLEVNNLYFIEKPQNLISATTINPEMFAILDNASVYEQLSRTSIEVYSKKTSLGSIDI